MSAEIDAHTKQLTDLIKEQVLHYATSWELQELISTLSDENDEACGKFCDRYELGNWFYEALILHDIDITELLVDLGNERELEEKEAQHDRDEIEHDLRRAQGWPA